MEKDWAVVGGRCVAGRAGATEVRGLAKFGSDLGVGPKLEVQVSAGFEQLEQVEHCDTGTLEHAAGNKIRLCC